MTIARGKCGAAPLQVGTPHAPGVERDEIGPYVLLKTVVRSASTAAANMRLRECPYALSTQSMNVMRIARRVQNKVRTMAEEAPQASAALVGQVEIALAEIAHVIEVERRENSGE